MYIMGAWDIPSEDLIDPIFVFSEHKFSRIKVSIKFLDFLTCKKLSKIIFGCTKFSLRTLHLIKNLKVIRTYLDYDLRYSNPVKRELSDIILPHKVSLSSSRSHQNFDIVHWQQQHPLPP